MTEDKLTEQQFKTLFLVNAINVIAKNNKSEDVRYNYAGNIYFDSYINDKESTIQLLNEILELEELGYVKTSYKAEDLQNDDKLRLRLNDTLKIKVLVSLSEIKNELQIADEELLKIVEEVWESDKIQELLAGKITKQDFIKFIIAIINSETTQNILNGINAAASIATIITAAPEIADIIARFFGM